MLIYNKETAVALFLKYHINKVNALKREIEKERERGRENVGEREREKERERNMYVLKEGISVLKTKHSKAGYCFALFYHIIYRLFYL